jgi:hypothetical protein
MSIAVIGAIGSAAWAANRSYPAAISSIVLRASGFIHPLGNVSRFRGTSHPLGRCAGIDHDRSYPSYSAMPNRISVTHPVHPDRMVVGMVASPFATTRRAGIPELPS